MDNFNRRSSKGASLASVYILETGLVQNVPSASLSPALWMLSSWWNWYWMLCHTQYIHNLAWNEQWSGTASAGILCLLPTSSVQPLGWDWEFTVLCTNTPTSRLSLGQNIYTTLHICDVIKNNAIISSILKTYCLGFQVIMKHWMI